MVIKLTIAYRGTQYAGWQAQMNALGVQEVVETALNALLGTRLRVHGAGRTDAGVHAHGQVAHFRLDRPFPLRGLVYGGNHRLPEDVRFLTAERMPDGFHARKAAIGKCYAYRIYRDTVVPPQQAGNVAHVPQPLNLDRMRQALSMLPGRHDFTAFASAGGSHTQPMRRIFAASLDGDAELLTVRILGEGFLRGMVRALVGTLLEIGRERRQAEDMRRLLTGQPRGEAGPNAPAAGLVLERVFYPPRWQPLGDDAGTPLV
jgi:tRNA pseudouridine38-40 synthase